jgi:elongation factor G
MNSPPLQARPLVWTTLHPVNTDGESVRRALAKLAKEDPTFKVEDEEIDGQIVTEIDGQIVIAAMGYLHLEIICDRLAREHHVHVEAAAPKVLYVETIRDISDGEGKFISQSRSRSRYAHVVIRIEPNPARGYELVDELPEGAFPKTYVEPISRGIQYALKSGVIAGYEIVDVKVILCDGSYHDTDSDEESFETAGFMAFKDAVVRANPILLEPVMAVQVIVPEEFVGAIMGDVNSRRGRIQGMENREGNAVISALVPLADMIGYTTDLRSMTQGRCEYSAKFSMYEQASGPPPTGDNRIGVTANRPWKPKPKHGAEAAQPPWLDD